MRVSEPERPRIRAVSLSARDIDDAKRLLRLLSTAGATELDAAQPRETGPTSADELRLRARRLVENRKRRENIFDREMFGEVAWDILLLLYVLEPESRQTITQLVTLSRASKSTALRWLAYLEDRNLIERADHPTDRRTTFIGLTEAGREKLEKYLSQALAAEA